MLKLLFGKDRTEKIAESLVGSYQEIAKKIAEKVSIRAEPTASEEAIAAEKKRVEIEETKLQLEKDKLGIEKERLLLERGEKLTAALDVANLMARSTRYAANIRAGATLLAAVGVTYATYEYFRPLEDELKNANAELAETKGELDKRTEGFMLAHIASKQWKKIVEKAEHDFVHKSENETAVKEYEKFKEQAENERQEETEAAVHDLEYARLRGK